MNVGDEVMIRKDSEYYDLKVNIDNPRDITGIITNINENSSFTIEVSWNLNGWNVYNESDLILVE